MKQKCNKRNKNQTKNKKITFLSIRSNCLFCREISSPMSAAMFFRLPKTLPTACMLSSISSSRASLLILWMYGPFAASGTADPLGWEFTTRLFSSLLKGFFQVPSVSLTLAVLVFKKYRYVEVYIKKLQSGLLSRG